MIFYYVSYYDQTMQEIYILIYPNALAYTSSLFVLVIIIVYFTISI